MAIVRAQVTFPQTTLMPKDDIVNSFFFHPAGTGAEVLEDIAVTLEEFYTVKYGAMVNKLDYYLASTLSRVSNKASVQLYDMADALPRVPLLTTFFTLGPPGNIANQPSETALCSSYKGDYVSGTPKARQRGRIYFGPLSNVAADVAANQPSRPTGVFRSDLSIASKRLAVASQTLGIDWGVYSRVNDAITLITGGWVDDDWDTQRRRSASATTRTVWTTAT